MHVVKKKIDGKEYYYLKISARFGDKVKTKNVAYLGKSPMTNKEIDKKIKEISKSKIELAKKELEGRFDNINNKFLTPEEQDKLAKLKEEFAKKIKRLDKHMLDDMFKDFKTFYIYNTNAIEGNSLTLQETNLLLNENQSPEGKDLREIYDHINEKETFDYILNKKPAINKELIIDLHSRLLKNIDKRRGSFRAHNVRVFGAKFQTTDAKYVAADMKILLQWYNQQKNKLHHLVLVSLFHEKFERVHPFYDGNGRTGRMLLNLILLYNGFPPLIIKNKDRMKYYEVLNKGHKADLISLDPDHYKPIVRFCYQQMIKTYEEVFSKWG